MGWFSKKEKDSGEPKKPFKETGFGKFLDKAGDVIMKNGGDVLNIAGKVATGNITGAFGDVANMLKGDDSPEAKELLNEFELQKMTWEKEIFALEIQDKDSARKMYVEEHDKADSIATKIIDWNLPVIGVLLGIEIACIIYMREYPEVLAIISAAVGGVTQSLISERQTVVQFFFGSSMGSKKKQQHIENK